LPIAPVVTTATTSIPTPPSVPLPPVLDSANAAPVVAPPTVNPVSGVDLDVRGLPWDARIHSGGKTKLKNGNWVNKRGVPDNTIETIEGELRALMAIPAPSVTTVAPVTDVLAPPAIPAPPAAAVTTAPPVSPSSTFPALMQKIAAALANHTLNQAQLSHIAQAKGLTSIPALAQRPDLIGGPDGIEAHIDAVIAANVASGAVV